MLKIGEVAVYPGHGVGRIESIEDKVISGTKQSFYIMRILDSDMTIMIPVDSAQHAGLRYVIDSGAGPEGLRDPEGQELYPRYVSVEQALQGVYGADQERLHL